MIPVIKFQKVIPLKIYIFLDNNKTTSEDKENISFKISMFFVYKTEFPNNKNSFVDQENIFVSNCL